MTSRWPPPNATSSSSSNPTSSSGFSAADQYELAQADNSHDNQPQFSGSSGVHVYDKNYVENLRKSYSIQMSEKQSVRNSQKIGSDLQHICKRLKEHNYPLDMSSLTCLQRNCGRSFDRVQVLAFHVSYAHQDLMTADSNNLTCLLCGKKWTTVRRKIMHLSLAHREIGEEHNSQCMLQVESVIAPNAPKAIRLEKARRMYDSGLAKPADFNDPDPFLEEPSNDEVFQIDF